MNKSYFRSHKNGVTLDDVIWCYRTILQREPESKSVLLGHLNSSKNLRALAEKFMDSDEYRLRTPGKYNTISSQVPLYDLKDRISMTTGCTDCSSIPKVSGAGGVYDKDGVKVQLMHEGTEVILGGYCGDWMSEVINTLQGHHEPQEELVFHHLIQYARPKTRIVELGANWAYYSNWYLGAVEGAVAVCLEPDINSMRVGEENLRINDRHADWLHACVGAEHFPSIEMKNESDGEVDQIPCHNMDSLLGLIGGEPIEVMHMDIQGAELPFLSSCQHAAVAELLRFLVVSTHHESISGSRKTHADCIQEIVALGGYILCEHSVEESYSGDGLIVASFHQEDTQIEFPSMSRNAPSRSLFGPSSGALDRVELAHAETGPMLFLGNDRIIGRNLRDNGSFEQEVISEVTEFLKNKYSFQSEQFVDIGANIGTHLIYALKMAGFKQGFAVEMEEDNFSLLQCNVILNDLPSKAKLFQVALSDEIGESLIELAEDNFGDHRVRVRSDSAQPQCGEDSRRTKAVSSTTLRQLVQNGDITINHNFLIWVDTQGHEGQVLSGGSTVLRSTDQPFLVIEFWPYAIDIAGGREPLFEALKQYDAFFDLNMPDWQDAPLRLDDVVDLYEKLRPSEQQSEQPFTDILCVPRAER